MGMQHGTSANQPVARRSWFLDQPIRHQVVVLLVLYILIVGALASIIRWKTAEPQADLEVLNHAARVSDLADDLTIALLDGYTSIALYLTTGNEIYLDHLREQQVTFRSLVATIGEEIGPGSPEQWQRLSELVQALRFETVEPAIELRTAVNNGTATQDDLTRFIGNSENMRRFNDVRHAIDDLTAAERQLAAEHETRILDLVDNLQWIYLAGSLVLIVFGILIAIHIDVDITSPIQRITRMARDIGSGNLDRRIGGRRSDEIGQMAATFDDMVDRLQEMIQARDASLREIQQKEAVQAAMLDGSVEGLALISPDYRIMTVNHRLSDLVGTDLTAYLGQDVMSLIPLAHRIFVDPDRVIRETVATIRCGDEDATIHMQQHYPVARDLEGYSTVVRGSNGENMGRLMALRDVTRERQSDRMKTEFVSMVSHELRTPLTSVKGYVDLLRDGELGELTEDQIGFLNIVANSTDRLVALINDLLDISRIESGKLLLDLTPLDVADRIREVVATLRPRLEEKRQQLSLALPAEPLPVMGDATRIDQILTNLLTNAIKYTPEGGVIGIVAELDAATVAIEITDSGIGIAESDHDQLFNRFYRSDNPAVRQISGTGLGLAITRSLVELHGGAIAFESELGAGSTFRITLPRVTDIIRVDWATGLGQTGRQILFILDAPAVALRLVALFERYGHVGIVAASAAEGLRLARDTQPSVVFVSDHLPDADALSVIHALRAEPALPDLGLVLLSYAGDWSGVLGGGDDAGGAPVVGPVIDDRVLRLLAFEGTYTVLAGGDHLPSRRLIAAIIRQGGHQVIETAGGVAAVEATLTNEVDLALINSMMSDDDQYKLLRSLRRNARTRNVPLIAMITAVDSASVTQMVVEALSALMFDPPPTTAELIAMIELVPADASDDDHLGAAERMNRLPVSLAGAKSS